MAINEPKMTRAALDVINNTYVIRNGLLYEYYSISCVPHTDSDKFIRFLISPGVMGPGIAIVNKKLYDVSLDDLFRRRINVAKQHGRAADANVSKPIPAKKTENSSESKSDSDQQGVSSLFGSEVDQVANLAWENQVNALLETLSAEEGEEFEITSSA